MGCGGFGFSCGLLGLGVGGPAFLFCGGVGFGCGEAVVVRDGLVPLFLELFRSFVRALGPRRARVLAEGSFERDIQVNESIGDVAGGGFVVLGNVFDHLAGGRSGAGAGVVLHRNVEGANDERCALHLDGVAQQRIDDFGERGLGWIPCPRCRRADAGATAAACARRDACAGGSSRTALREEKESRNESRRS
jgi:hypothetical protein